MRKDLGWAIFGLVLALLMVPCIIINVANNNWGGVVVCSFALGLNLTNALNRFREYREYQDYERQRKRAEALERLNEGIQACWPEKENRITE